MSTLVDFLLARYDEDEERFRDVAGDEEHQRYAFEDCPDLNIDWMVDVALQMLAQIRANRQIVELHRDWPVLLEKPPVMKMDPEPGSDRFEGSLHLLSMSVSMEREYAWVTQQKYREQFGDEPPTAPMLRALVSVYAEHPDYQPEWSA